MTDQCSPDSIGDNVGLAFGLVAAAGMSTAIGGAVVFVLPKKSSTVNLWLASALALAAGVMIYVSFVEIFSTKAVDGFAACVPDEGLAYLYATLCFFGGVILCWGLDVLIHYIDHKLVEKMKRKEEEAQDDEEDWKEDSLEQKDGDDEHPGSLAGQILQSEVSVDVETPWIPQPSAPVEPMNPEEEVPEARVAFSSDNIAPEMPIRASSGSEAIPIETHEGEILTAFIEAERDAKDTREEKRKLARMGMFAALAIAFHNFPEGLATFVAALSEPSVGVSVAIAIGIHNIPEGMSVAVPIYYATGSKWKGFFWATASGLTELIGAFLGWLILANVFTELVYGILFGIVGGMMVYIAIGELLPTAHRYDPKNKVITVSWIFGMVIMALSLVLFAL
uniref:Uncharacterized protein n=1 Tax=Rhodosorus marinus TaxID=101924 RepID=A0A7S0BFQ6_9RHOD|mmetsp:Transcript_1294/g.2013  ORF Transcript_1294/g.2013 Transcript_1294/m.2013 type:complete len:393 (+) Transcript_1294:303-1481(+)